MNLILFYDTETTGLPDWHEPSEAPHQPHIVQLAAKLVDADTRAVVESLDLIAAPDGWLISADVAAVHGITTAYAMQVGVPEATVMEALLALWRRASTRIGHNESFDARILRIATKRYASEEVIDAWKAGAAECTVRITKPMLQLEPRNRYGWKSPKLSEAYAHFMGRPLENAHNAMADVDACMAVYFAAKDQLALAVA
ncbi:3'-5' exonuclease [Chitiniphilus eburneus]|uniref:3'-5' exonuclease n=1 Tax=Chitiniphilus eburneus TaxID=2571148 RepID=UPI0035CF18FD